MLTYLVERLNNFGFLKHIFYRLFPVHCLGCKLESDNNESVCSVCEEILIPLGDRCWVCCSRLYEEEEHIFCRRCSYQKGKITKSSVAFEDNALLNALIDNGITKNRIRESIFLAQCMRKYTDIQNVRNMFVLSKKHKCFLENYLDIPATTLVSKGNDTFDEINLFIPKLISIACLESKLQKIFKSEDVNIKLYSISVYFSRKINVKSCAIAN